MTSYASWSRSRPELRASDAEREHIARTLRDHAAEGRLTPDELEERVGAAYRAVHVRDLEALVADLPMAGPPRRLERRRRHPVLPVAALGTLAVVMPGIFWLAMLTTAFVGFVVAAVTLAALGFALGPIVAIVMLVLFATRRHRGRRYRHSPAGWR
jgi:energy-converting hydrogenase Eha subunit C